MRIVIALVIIVLLALGWFYFNSSEETSIEAVELPIEEKVAVKPIERKAPEASQVTEANVVHKKIKPVELDDSDNSVSRLLNTQLLSWMVNDEYIRRFVVVTTALSEGNLPKDLKVLKKTIKPFVAKKMDEDGVFVVDDNTFQRFDSLIDAITAVDPDALLNYYNKNELLFEQAYQELGMPGTFKEKLKVLIDRVLRFEYPETSQYLYTKSVAFKFKNENLEKASDLNKFLWRLGKINTDRIKTFLSKIKI